MDPLIAAFNVVHDHPGGAAALGPMMGKNPATLSHEVNPNYPTAKLGLADAVKLTQLTGDRRIASAFASQVGCMLLPLPDLPEDSTTFEAIAKIAREFADLSGEVARTVEDGSVSANELQRVQREAAQLVAAVEATVARVARMHAETSRGRVLEFVSVSSEG